jgi:hypothetical protein
MIISERAHSHAMQTLASSSRNPSRSNSKPRARVFVCHLDLEIDDERHACIRLLRCFDRAALALRMRSRLMESALARLSSIQSTGVRSPMPLILSFQIPSLAPHRALRFECAAKACLCQLLELARFGPVEARRNSKFAVKLRRRISSFDWITRLQNRACYVHTSSMLPCSLQLRSHSMWLVPWTTSNRASPTDHSRSDARFAFARLDQLNRVVYCHDRYALAVLQRWVTSCSDLCSSAVCAPAGARSSACPLGSQRGGLEMRAPHTAGAHWSGTLVPCTVAPESKASHELRQPPLSRRSILAERRSRLTSRALDVSPTGNLVEIRTEQPPASRRVQQSHSQALTPQAALATAAIHHVRIRCSSSSRRVGILRTHRPRLSSREAFSVCSGRCLRRRRRRRGGRRRDDARGGSR